MILLHCVCGTDSTVEDGMAGKKVRCPGCNRILDVPQPGAAGAAEAPPRKFKGYTSKAAGILLGLLLLVTLMIPIGFVVPQERASEVLGTPVWATQAVQSLWERTGSLGGDWAFGGPRWMLAGFVGLWVVGLLVLLAGAFLRRLPLAVFYLAGAAGLIVLTFGNFRWSDLLANPYLQLWTAEGIWAVLLVAAFLLVTALRKKMGGRVILCILQILLAGGLLALVVYTAIQIYPAVHDRMTNVTQHYDRLLRDPENANVGGRLAKAMNLDLIRAARPAILLGLVGLAALLSLIHGITFSKRTRTLSALAVTLTVLGVILWLVVGNSDIVLSGRDRVFNWNNPDSSDYTLADWGRRAIPQLHLVIRQLALICLPLAAVAGFIADLFGAFGVRPTWWNLPPKEGEEIPTDTAPVQRPAPPPPAPAPAPTPTRLTPGQRLDQLKALKDRGSLTEEEYQARREEILKEL